MKPARANTRLLIPPAIAITLFLWLFIKPGLGPLDFWWSMALILVLVVGMSLGFDRDLFHRIQGMGSGWRPWRVIAAGLFSAVILYGVFSLGGILLRLLFPAAGAGIRGVYTYRGEASPLRIALLMLLVIGPGEEFFWRGMVQHHLVRRLGPLTGIGIAALVYTLIHLTAGNPVLLLAAMVCGLFWGLLYHFTQSLPLVVISHTAWDILVFLAIPLGG